MAILKTTDLSSRNLRRHNIFELISRTKSIKMAEDEEVGALFALKKKKSGKKKAKAEASEETTVPEETTETVNVDSSSSAATAVASTEADIGIPNYSYTQLLERVVDFVQQNNPELAADGKRFKMKPPQLMRVGTKKTLWVNFPEICNMMHRSSDHVFQFMMAELGTEGSIDGMKRLVIRGKFVPKYIESLLRKYIMEYVVCQMCRSFNTDLSRDGVSRLYFVSCKDCGSSRSVAQIRAGFHAQTRADRRALRNAP